MARTYRRGLGISDLLAAKRAEVLRLAAQHGASNIRVFGSVARGEAADSSDIDLLIAPNPSWSLLDRIRFKRALEALLHARVDLVTDATLHPRLRRRILKEAVPL